VWRRHQEGKLEVGKLLRPGGPFKEHRQPACRQDVHRISIKSFEVVGHDSSHLQSLQPYAHHAIMPYHNLDVLLEVWIWPICATDTKIVLDKSDLFG